MIILLSHTERKILNVCFHLNRKGSLSIREICNKTRKKPDDVQRIVKRLHDLGYVTRNNRGQVEVHLGTLQQEDEPPAQRDKPTHHTWFE